MMAEYGISGFERSSGLTGILPYLFKRKEDAYATIVRLESDGGYGLKVIEFTWDELYKTPVNARNPQVTELQKRLNEALDNLK